MSEQPKEQRSPSPDQTKTKEKKKEARPIIRSSESGTVRRIKQYTLLTRLGQGSFAEVFLAKSDVDETYCAAKVFDKSLLRRKRTISRTVEGFKIHSELDKARPHLRLDHSQHRPGKSG